jgi:purine-nucleoside phosphorylase
MTAGASLPQDLAGAVSAVRARSDLVPRAAVILGSGLGRLAGEIEDPVVIPYQDLPGCPVSTVPGHAGELVLGRLEGVEVAAMKGRAHLYEGFTPAQVAFPVRLLHALGARLLVATNAAGSLRPDIQTGTVMVLEDHINLPGFGGLNPLVGEGGGSERFVDMAAAYDPRLRESVLAAAREMGIRVSSGVYVMVMGPSYETPAEARMLRALGADAVGMSTVPEVITARRLGMRVLALSSITNQVLGGPDPIEGGHEGVVSTADRIAGDLILLLRRVIGQIASDEI